MKTAVLTFAQLEIAERRAHKMRILRAETQTEAARELLDKATATGADPTFWRAALDWAEANEASARRDFANWQRRDRKSAHQTHEFFRALFGATTSKLKTLEETA